MKQFIYAAYVNAVKCLQQFGFLKVLFSICLILPFKFYFKNFVSASKYYAFLLTFSVRFTKFHWCVVKYLC